MTAQEIEQAALKWCTNQENSLIPFNNPIRLFYEGANFVNEKQPYTKEDMVSFANMVSMYECDPETGLYFLHGQKYIKVVHKTTECLLRIWEEKK